LFLDLRHPGQEILVSPYKHSLSVSKASLSFELAITAFPFDLVGEVLRLKKLYSSHVATVHGWPDGSCTIV